MKQQQSGFTLIELIMVIVILGILAATALPKFVNLAADAQRAAVAGVFGGFNSAVSVARARWMIDGASPGTVPAGCTAVTCTTGAVSTIDGVAVGFGGSGYPVDNVAMTTMVLGVPTMTDATCVNVWQAILGGQGPTIIATTPTLGRDWVATAASPICTYTFYAGTTTTTGRSFTYNASTGVMAVTNPNP